MWNLSRRMLVGCIAVVAMSVAVHADSVTYDFNTAGDLDLNFSRILSGGSSPQSMYGESASGGINDTGSVLVNQQSNSEVRFEKAAFPVTLTTWTQSIYFQATTRSWFATSTNPLIALGVAANDTAVPSYSAAGGVAHLTVGVTPRTDGYRLFIYSNNTTLETKYATTYTLTENAWYYLAAEFTEQLDGTYNIEAGVYNASADGTVGTLVKGVSSWNATNSQWLSEDPATAHAFFESTASAHNGGIGRLDNFTTAAVPEPVTIALFSLGGVALLRRR